MTRFCVKYLPDDGFILVRLSGDFDAQALSQSTSKVVKEISRSACSRILMDHRDAVPKLSVTELFHRPKVAFNLGVPNSSRIAIVYSHPDEVYDFIETVGTNSGFIIKVFKSTEDAVLWLKL